MLFGICDQTNEKRPSQHIKICHIAAYFLLYLLLSQQVNVHPLATS